MANLEQNVVDIAPKTPNVIQAGTDDSLKDNYAHQTRWQKIQEVIWDGGSRTPEERKLIQRLDIHLMSWATYGYFIRLLDSGNISESDSTG